MKKKRELFFIFKSNFQLEKYVVKSKSKITANITFVNFRIDFWAWCQATPGLVSIDTSPKSQFPIRFKSSDFLVWV